MDMAQVQGVAEFGVFYSMGTIDSNSSRAAGLRHNGQFRDLELQAKKDEPQVSEEPRSREGSENTLAAAAATSAPVAPVETPVRDVLEADGEVQYKNLQWWQVSMIMIAETISLGILSLPHALSVLGLLPGLICILGLGLLAAYAGYVIGQFKLAHPQVVCMADAGHILFGNLGKRIFGTGSTMMLVFFMASHILTFSIMMNVLTQHGTCSIFFGCIGFVLSAAMTLPRTLHSTVLISIASFISVTTAVMITMIALGMTKKGGEDIVLVMSGQKAALAQCIIAIMDIIIAYAGNVAFFGFISELRRPEDFPKALGLLQSVATTFYLLVAAVVYYYAGSSVPAPALGATSPLVRKVAYGIAIPTILVAGVINGHVAVKYVYIYLWRDFKKTPEVVTEKGGRARSSWIIICVITWAVAWMLAEAIPDFSVFLAFIGALFGTWFTYGVSGILWLHMNKGKYAKSWKKMSLFAVNVFLVAFAASSCIIGLWASGKQIHDDAGGKSFSCADTSV